MFDRKTYLIKERIGLLKLTDTYDIFDAESGDQLAIALEEISGFMKLLRFLVKKAMLPTTVNFYEGTEQDRGENPVLSIHRGFTLLRAKVLVLNAKGETIGYFKSKIFSLGGGFKVYDTNDEQIADVSGDWKGFNFKLKTTTGKEIGVVAKKWGGIAKEMFTSADNYVVSLNDDVAKKPAYVKLLLAAGLAIDTIYKEN